MRYGTAWPWPLPVVYAPANDITLTADTEVLAITTTSALKAQAGLSWVPVIFGTAVITLGGTAATGLTIAARFNGGSDFATQVIPAGVLVNSAVLVLPICMVGAAIDAGADGSVGSGAIEITGDAAAHAATWTKIGTALSIMLIPGGSS